MISCTKKRKNINGHWYMHNITGNIIIPYAEIIIYNDSVNVYDEGDYWHKESFNIDSDSVVKIGSFYEGRMIYLSSDSLIFTMPDKENERIVFRKLFEQGEPFKEYERLRRFLYMTKYTSLNDTNKVEQLKNEMWYFFGGATDDSLILEEDILILGPKD